MRYSLEHIDAVVLAGGINKIVLFNNTAPKYKGLIECAGKTFIQYILDALEEVPNINRIGIVGSQAVIRGALQNPGRYEFIPEGETPLASIHHGLSHFSGSDIVLFLPWDLPLITSRAITSFLEVCKSTDALYGANIFWSMVPEKSFTGPYRKMKKGFNRFRDIAVCHGNLMLMTPQLLRSEKISSHLDAIYNARKSSIKVAMAVSPRIGLIYYLGVHLLRIVTIERMAQIVSRELEVGLIPVLLSYPEAAIDADERYDFVIIKEVLERGDHF